MKNQEYFQKFACLGSNIYSIKLTKFKETHVHVRRHKLWYGLIAFSRNYNLQAWTFNTVVLHSDDVI